MKAELIALAKINYPINFASKKTFFAIFPALTPLTAPRLVLYVILIRREPIGFQIGGQSKDIILLFMTQEALSQFRASKGWEAGIDGNIALISVGGGERVDTTTSKDPIIGFVFDSKGLIADISLKGAKFSKIDK